MNEQPSNSKVNIGLISSIINKLTPKIIGLIIIVGLLLITAIIGLAVQKGQKLSLPGVTIEPSGQVKNPNIPKNDKVIDTVGSISASDLCTLSDKYFNSSLNKDQLINVIRQLIDRVSELEKLEANINYKLTKMELMIQDFGNAIDTKIKDKDRVESYKKIQSILKAIGFFESEVDGDQHSTNIAVINFQKTYNQNEKKKVFEDNELGYFGYTTCAAIRRWIRKNLG